MHDTGHDVRHSSRDAQPRRSAPIARADAESGQQQHHAPSAPAGSDPRKPSPSPPHSPSLDENRAALPRLSPTSHRPSSPHPSPASSHLSPSPSVPRMTVPPSQPQTAQDGERASPSDDDTDLRLHPSQISSSLLCPCCVPPAPLVVPTTLRCGHTVCAAHLQPTEEAVSATDALTTITLPEPAEPAEYTDDKQPEPGPARAPEFLPRPARAPRCPVPACAGVPAAGQALHPRIPPGSRVAYTPAPPPAEGAFAGVPLAPRADVTVAKVLAVVQRAARAVADEAAAGGVVRARVPAPDEGTDDEDEDPASARASPTLPHARRARAPSDTDADPPPPRKRRRRAPPSPPAAGPAATPPDAPLDAHARFEKELLAELTCEICFVLLYQPVTAPCQHTFCAKCLQRSLDYSAACPLCRHELPGFAYFQDHPQNKLLLSIILQAFPGHYRERAAAIEAEERDTRLDTPIFVCLLSFPGVPTYLHFFEPRYRLMLRRCLESPSHRFGMMMPPRAGQAGPAEYGTMLEIRSVQMLADGRSMVETWGTHRFRVLERGTLDGYTVARVERVDDVDDDAESDDEPEPLLPEPDAVPTVPAPSASRPRAALAGLRAAGRVARGGGAPERLRAPSNVELMEHCRAFVTQLRAGTAPWVVQRLNNTYGPMPDDASSFSFWMALVLPIDEHEKAKLLPIKSPRLRLKLIVHWIEELNSNWWFSSGCVVL